MSESNGGRPLNDFGGFDRRQDEGDLWLVFAVTDPTTTIAVRAKSWFEARAQGIVHFHGDYSTIDARLAGEERG